jgi:hypothetical protein
MHPRCGAFADERCLGGGDGGEGNLSVGQEAANKRVYVAAIRRASHVDR